MGFLQLIVYGLGLIFSLAWTLSFTIGYAILNLFGKADEANEPIVTCVGAPFVLALVYLLTRLSS